ncbi:MAG: hypothetical protein U0Q12_17770 [Vicinamibacterales bacterium]
MAEGVDDYAVDFEGRPVLHLTERLHAIVCDLVERLPELHHIDPQALVVFARVGRRGAQGPIAACHCLDLPESEPGYFFWRDVVTGDVRRRSPYFVRRAPEVSVRGRRIRNLLSVSLPRFCEQSLVRQPKGRYYRGEPDWVAKLDTIVHELYHINPDGPGLRVVRDAGGRPTSRVHSERFLQDVARLVQAYLTRGPRPGLLDCLQYDFVELERRHGLVVGTTFGVFPGFPQLYSAPIARQPRHPRLPIVPLADARRRTAFDDRDLVCRRFLQDGRTSVVPAPGRRDQVRLPDAA